MRRTDSETADKTRQAGADMAPVVWLLGKVQSGKSSIIRALTGESAAAVGNGFRPCTRSSAIFDFPAEAPIIRFLDTRGLGEASYDPAEDIAFCRSRAHLLLCTMRAMDVQQDAVRAALATVRRENPTWPIVIAQTTLHEAYPGRPHPDPYPFDDDGRPLAAAPLALARALAAQRRLFEPLAGKGHLRFVPIDFTQPEDGFDPADYGMPALKRALHDAAPLALVAALEDDQARAADPRTRQAHSSIVKHAVAAAAGSLLPFAGLVAVPGVQAKLLASLADLYDVEWNTRTAAELAGALGTGTLTRALGSLGARELGKLIPIWGQTVGAAAASAASFAATYALGKAAAYYLGRRHLGARAREGVVETYREAFRAAFKMARDQTPSTAGKPADAP